MTHITEKRKRRLIKRLKQKFLRERQYITLIYCSLIGLIASNAFLEFILPSTMIRMLELSFCLSIGVSICGLYINRSLVRYHGWNLALIVLLSISLLQIFIRGDWENLSLKDFGLYFLSQRYSIPYLIPFVILFLPNRRHTNRIFSIFFWSSLLTIPLWLLNSGKLIQEEFQGESIGAYLPYFACFLLAIPKRMPSRKTTILWVIWGVYLLLMILNARRNMVFTLMFFGALAIYIKFKMKIRNSAVRYMVITFMGILVATPLLSSLTNAKGSVFERIVARANEDTRSDVEMFFWADFYTSPPAEWAFGRGGYGSYYQEMRNEDTGELETDRHVVETGYLDMLLKGGVSFVLIVVVLMIRSMIVAGKNRPKYLFTYEWLMILFFIDFYTTNGVCTYSTFSLLFWFTTNMMLNSHQHNILHRRIKAIPTTRK